MRLPKFETPSAVRTRQFRCLVVKASDYQVRYLLMRRCRMPTLKQSILRAVLTLALGFTGQACVMPDLTQRPLDAPPSTAAAVAVPHTHVVSITHQIQTEQAAAGRVGVFRSRLGIV